MLIVVDEANRLQMNSLEQLRSIFDEGSLGMVLIGMPGIEKRIARFPQFYSRIGFVHEFRPLDAIEMQALLDRHWTCHAAVKARTRPLAFSIMFRCLTALQLHVKPGLQHSNPGQTSTQTSSGI